jgi:hypothetical protein
MQHSMPPCSRLYLLFSYSHWWEVPLLTATIRQKQWVSLFLFVLSIDYRCEDRKTLQVKRRHWWHYKLIRLNSRIQKIPIIAPEKRTFQPGDAFEDTGFEQGIEIVKF